MPRRDWILARCLCTRYGAHSGAPTWQRSSTDASAHTRATPESSPGRWRRSGRAPRSGARSRPAAATFRGARPKPPADCLARALASGSARPQSCRPQFVAKRRSSLPSSRNWSHPRCRYPAGPVTCAQRTLQQSRGKRMNHTEYRWAAGSLASTIGFAPIAVTTDAAHEAEPAPTEIRNARSSKCHPATAGAENLTRTREAWIISASCNMGSAL